MKNALPRTVVILGLVSFCNDLASEMVVPLIPILLATVLSAGPVALGLVEGVADAVASLLKLWSGRHSDLIGGRRKGLAVGGYTLSNLVRPLIGAVGSWPALLLLRSLDRVGKGLRTAPRDALVGDSTPPEIIGRAFGFHRAMDNAGALLGALAAAAVLYFGGLPLEHVIFLSAIPGFLAVSLFAFGVRNPPARAPVSPKPLPPLRLDALSPLMRRYLGALAIFTLARATETFILLRGFSLGMGAVSVLLLWAFIHLAKTATGTYGGRLADRIGRRPVLLLGWVAFGVSYGAFAAVEGVAPLWVVALAYGLFFGLSEGAERAVINDLASAAERGTAFGWYNLSTGLAAVPAGLLFGGVWHYLGAQAAFGLSAFVALGAALLLALWVYPSRREALRG